MTTLHSLRTDIRRLDDFQLFASGSPSEVRAGVASVLCPHELVLSDPYRPCDARLSRMNVGDLSLIALRYGSDVSVRPEPSSGFVMIQFVLSGWIKVEHGGHQFDCRANQGLIIESLDERRLHWSADCEQLIIPIRRAALSRAAEMLTGRPAPARFDFATTFDLDGAAGLSLVALTRYLLSHTTQSAASRPTGALAMDLMAHHLLINHRDPATLDPQRTAIPYHVRRAEAFMRSHLLTRIGLEEIADHARVSVRTLSTAFRRFRGTSPMERLRHLRLDHARTSLSSGFAPTVAHAAAQAGFTHAGRFSQVYRDHFGESPHVTLGAARRDGSAARD